MPEIFDKTVEPAQKGSRLDVLLAIWFPERSRGALQNLVKQGAVLVDGQPSKPGHKLRGRESVRIEMPELTFIPPFMNPTPLTFPILFEDEDLIVVNKPVGLVVHPGAGHEVESVVSAVLSHCPLSPVGAPFRPGVIHRLDKPTSGVLVLAKTEWMHQKLVKAFSTRRVDKEYLALVQGAPETERGRIDVAITRDREQRKKMAATTHERGKSAISVFEVVECFPGVSLVKVNILTGRTHQIRVHMAYIRTPLLGDTTYGGRIWMGREAHYLHSQRLAFTHPRTRKKMDVVAPIPEAFEEILQDFRRRQSDAGKDARGATKGG